MSGIAKPSFWQPGFGNDWLEQLHELMITEPLESSLWPQSLGLYLLLAMLLCSLYYFWQSYRRHQKMRAFQLRLLLQLSTLAEGPAAIAGLSEFIKRLARYINHADKAEGQSLAGVDGFELKQVWSCLSQAELAQIQTWAFLPPERLASQKVEADRVLEKLQQHMHSPAFLRQLKQGAAR